MWQTGSKFYKARMFKAPAELSTSSQDLKWKSLPRRETERSSNMCGDFPHGKFTKSLAAAEKLGSRAELGKRLRSWDNSASEQVQGDACWTPGPTGKTIAVNAQPCRGQHVSRGVTWEWTSSSWSRASSQAGQSQTEVRWPAFILITSEKRK